MRPAQHKLKDLNRDKGVTPDESLSRLVDAQQHRRRSAERGRGIPREETNEKYSLRNWAWGTHPPTQDRPQKEERILHIKIGPQKK